MNRDILNIINSTPQKYEDFGTISYQMKYDIYDFFKEKNLNCLEIGAYKGYTTNLLSKIFKSVTALDNNEKNLNIANEINKNNSNINFVKVNLYDKNEWDEKIHKKYYNKFEVALVDAAHGYNEVKSDIINSINLGCKYLILDDVGVYDNIKKCVSEIKEEYKPKIKFIKEIGIDWFHYKSPILNINVYTYRMYEKNIGSSPYRFKWILQDKSDIKLNNGDVIRPLFDSINIQLEVVQNNIDLQSGHDVSNKIGLNVIGPFVNQKINNNNMFDFVAFPSHRFKGKEFMSMMMNDEMKDARFIYSDNDHNFEGLIIGLE